MHSVEGQPIFSQKRPKLNPLDLYTEYSMQKIDWGIPPFPLSIFPMFIKKWDTLTGSQKDFIKGIFTYTFGKK